jgi:hypothetical protein
MDDSQADGKGGPERSVPRFDPVAGMRAMADIQAEGLRAASELLERILRSEPAGSGSGSRSRSPAGDYSALVDAWTDLLRRTISGLTQPGQPGAVTVPIDSSGVLPPVRLSLDGSGDGDGAVAEVWLHNGTFSAVGPVALRCGPLTASDGAVLEGAGVRFEPRQVALLPSRSSQAVVVSLDATGPLRPGTYRGTIQADGAPRLWLPIEVAIEPC